MYGDLFGQLAAFERSATDDETGVGRSFELDGGTLGWECGNDSFFGEVLADRQGGRRQVAVGGNQKGGIEGVLKGIDQHFRCDANVRHLFFVGGPPGTAVSARAVFGQVMPLEHFEVGQRI